MYKVANHNRAVRVFQSVAKCDAERCSRIKVNKGVRATAEFSLLGEGEETSFRVTLLSVYSYTYAC